MKKIFILLSVFFATLFYFGNKYAKNDDEITLNKHYDYKTYVPEDNYVSEDDGYEYVDAYESNETVAEAFDVSTEILSEYDQFRIILNNPSLTNYYIPDVDYYSFTILSNSKARITFSNSEYLCYFKLFTFKSSLNEDNSTTYEEEVLYEETNGAFETEFIGDLQAGTYYIFICCDHYLEYENGGFYYELDMCFSSIENCDARIDELMMEKRLIGAIWKSDYTPFFGENISCISEVTYCDFGQLPDKTFEYIRAYASENDSIHAYSYYIWDNYTKQILRDIVLSVKTIFETEIKERQDKRNQLKMIYNYAEKAIQILFEKINISIPLDDILLKGFEYYINYTASEISYNEVKYVDFLATLAERLNNQLAIVEIPIYYKLNLPHDGKKGTLSFFPTADLFPLEPYSEDYLYANPERDYNITDGNCRGRLYGLSLKLDELIEIERYEDVPTKIDVSLSKPDEKEFNVLMKGEYIWIEFSYYQANTFHVYIEENDSIVVDVSYGPLPIGWSMDGIESTHNGRYVAQNGNKGTYFSLDLLANQKVYFRLREKNRNVAVNFKFYINFGPLENFYHEHNYTYSYEWINYSKHKANCECGDSIEQAHIVSGSPKIGSYYRCVVCGGLASAGIVGPVGIGTVSTFSLKSSRTFNNDSDYILASDGMYYPKKTRMINGIIELSYEDSLSVVNNPEYINTIINNVEEGYL